MIKKLTLLMAISTLFGNCLTISTVTENLVKWDIATNKKIIYSGTRERNPVIPGDFYMGRSCLVLTAYFGFAVVDTPLSFLLDTALLPITIPWAIYEESRPQVYRCDCFDRYSAFESCNKGGSCGSPDQTPIPDGRLCRPDNQSDILGPYCVLRYK